MSCTIRGQSSVEYLTIIGIAVMLLIPGIAFYMEYSQETNQNIVTNQLGVVGNDILYSAEEMYVYGENSWVTLDVVLPESFISARISENAVGSDLVFTYESPSGPSELAFFPYRFEIVTGENRTNLCQDVDCSINLNPGSNRIRIEAIDGNRVLIRGNV